jgi:hypothetical protein
VRLWRGAALPKSCDLGGFPSGPLDLLEVEWTHTHACLGFFIVTIISM